MKRRKYRKYKQKKWMIKKLIDEGLPAAEVARRCNVQRKTMYYWMKKLGLPIKSSAEARKGWKRKKRKHSTLKRNTRHMTWAWLKDEYTDKEKSMRQIAAENNCSEGFVRNRLIKYGIEIRPQFGRGISLEGKSSTWYYQQAYKAYEEYWREAPPKGYLIHHFDHDITNWDITNLPLVTRASHNTIHKTGKKQGREIQRVKVPQHMQKPAQVAA